MNSQELKILFLGDVTGRPGRVAVKRYLASCRDDYDFVIVNIENASHGFGLTKKNYEELVNAKIDCLTSGNHIWDKKDIFDYIDTAPNLIRPLNYPDNVPGTGCRIFDVQNEKIAVISLLGRIFMPPIDSPWQIICNKIDELKKSGVEHVFIDFHAEATAEKICFTKYLASIYNTNEHALIKGVFGTHTHVQTADESIVNGMGYITDAGFCGASDSVIGMEFRTSLKRLATGLPERYEIAESDTLQINGVELVMNKHFSTHIHRINLFIDNITEKEATVVTDNC